MGRRAAKTDKPGDRPATGRCSILDERAGSRPIAGGGVRPDARDLRVFRRTLLSALFDPRRAGLHGYCGESLHVSGCSSWRRGRCDRRCLRVLRSRRCACAQPATAPTLLDPVVVTAARSPQRLDQLLADVTVIGPEEIARAGAQSLADLLQRQPGVQIVTNGGPGSTTGVFLRGANAGQTLVLIDGLRVSSSSSGTTPFEAIPLDQIDHIEILRGPAASLYGSDAIGGVIQVFTRSGGNTFAANASAGYGTYNTSQFAARSVRRRRPMALHAAGWLQPELRLQRHRQSREFQLQPGPRRLSQRQRQRFARLHVRAGANAVGPGLLQPHERAVRRRAGFRRSHDHDAAKLCGGKPQPSDVVLEKHRSKPAYRSTTAIRKPPSVRRSSRRRSGSTRGRTISRCPWARCRSR